MSTFSHILLVMLLSIALGCATASRGAPNANATAPASLPNDHVGKDDSASASAIAPALEHIDPSAVSLVVRKETPALKRCYIVHNDQARPEERIKLKWTIDGAGRVLNVHVAETNIQNKNFERCVVETVASWSFPAPGKAIDIVYPFVFRPQ